MMRSVKIGIIGLCVILSTHLAAAEGEPKRRLDPAAKEVVHTPSVFRPDPQYGQHVYDAQQQWLIYGGKKAVITPRPLLELGRQFLTGGPYKAGSPSHLIVYGDVRLPAVSNYAENLGEGEDQQSTVAALQINLEVDLKFTAATRVHLLIQPLQSNLGGTPTFTRFFSDTAGQEDGVDSVHIFQRCKDESCDVLEAIDEFGTFFIEGDLGASLGADIDLPYALGKIPLIFQNGVWVEDAFFGGALTFPAKSSPSLDISNFDVTLFAGFEGVDSRASAPVSPNVDPSQLVDIVADLQNLGQVEDLGGGGIHRFSVFGTNIFADAAQGYWELGYGFSKDRDANEFIDLSYHNVTLAFSKRYADRIANSIRLIGNFGQKDKLSANGFAVLIENSLVTHKPSTLIPYLNLFIGFDRPQPLAKATGLLRNTGLAYEADIITFFPSLNDNLHDVAGGALGVEYLFSLDQQLVLEAAVSLGLCDSNEDSDCARQGAKDEAGLALRYQLPFATAWLIRADALVGMKNPLESQSQTFAGARLELRRKF